MSVLIHLIRAQADISQHLIRQYELPATDALWLGPVFTWSTGVLGPTAFPAYSSYSC